MNLTGLPALETNIIWIGSKNNRFIIVDPGEANPVVDFMSNNTDQIPLAILITHHHPDHTAGAQLLREQFHIPIYGPQHPQLPWIDSICHHNETIEINEDFSFNVFHTPGHTLEHLIYANETAVFTGDTLFSVGCGRLFEGTAKEMTQSLQCIKQLPEHLLLCCGHEYTVNNLLFAQSIEPNNTDLIDHLNWCKKQIKESKLTLPIPLKKEKKLNPFLRLSQQNLINCLQKKIKIEQNDPVTIFQHLRKIKDLF